MAKSKKVVPSKEDIQRRNMIKEYNKNNTSTQILMRKVRQEDIDSLEDELRNIQTRRAEMTYVIADSNNSRRVAEFLRNWNATKFIWSKDMWKGVIKFDEYIANWQNNANDDTDLVFDFAALSYSYNMLMSPGGVGLSDAQYMNEHSDEYDAILNTIGEYVDEFKLENDKFKMLQDCLSARYQGFMMVLADENTVVDEDVDDAAVVDDTSDNIDDNTPTTECTDEGV